MRLARSHQPLTMMYSLCNRVLMQTDSAKYLGITISPDLDWTSHMQSVCNKSSSTLAFLRRNLKSCPQHLKEQAYISLVRSAVEYAAAIWDTHKAGNAKSLENIQWKAGCCQK